MPNAKQKRNTGTVEQETGKEMHIKKVFNNNVVSSLDENDDEIILVGTGIGFQKKPGDIVVQAKVEKRFKLENQNLQQEFLLKVCNISYEHLKVSYEIVDKVCEKLGVAPTAAFYATMADHISFSITRYHKNQNFRNLLAEEIERFYPTEYQLGLEVVHYINEHLQVALPIDEAAAIALHIVNLSFELHMSFTTKVVKTVADIIDLVGTCFGAPIKEDTHGYGAFLVNIKYLLQKINKNERLPNKQQALAVFLAENYAKEWGCAKQIAAYIAQVYDYPLTNDQLCYLSIHIRQIT